MSWDQFVYFSVVAVLLWTVGAIAAWTGKRKTAISFTWG